VERRDRRPAGGEPAHSQDPCQPGHDQARRARPGPAGGDRLRARPGEAALTGQAGWPVRSVAGPAGRRAGRAPGRLIGPGPWGQRAPRTAPGKVGVWTSAHPSWVWPDWAWFDVVGPADGPGLPPDPHGLRDEVMAATPGRVATKYPPVTPSASIRCPFALGTIAAELDRRAPHLAVGVPRRGKCPPWPPCAPN